MNGTVVELVDVKVEGEGVAEQDVDHVVQSIHDQSIQESSEPKKGYSYMNLDVLDRQCVDEQMIEEVKKYPCIYNPSHMHARDPFLKETKWRLIAAKLNVSTEYCKLRWKSIRDRYVKIQKEEQRRIAAGTCINKLRKPYRFAEQLSFLNEYRRERKSVRDKQKKLHSSVHIHELEDEELSNQSEVARDDDDDERGSVEQVEQGWATIDGYISSPSSYHTNSDNTPQGHLTKNVKHRPSKKRLHMQMPSDEYVMNYLGMEEHNGPIVKRSAHDVSSNMELPGSMNQLVSPVEDTEQKYDEVLHFLVSLAPAMRRLPAQKQSLARIKIQTLLHELEFSGE